MDHFKNATPECIKLRVRNICLEDKAVKSETEQMKFDVENKCIDLKDSSLQHDIISIISNSDESKIPLFMIFFGMNNNSIFLLPKPVSGIIDRLFDIPPH